LAFDVFISYSSKDKAAADAACAALESAGIRCWIAPRDIIPGHNYGEAILDAIERAEVVVLILSGSANASPQIMREIERAVSKGVAILPLRIEDVLPARALEYFISEAHWLDAFPPPREKYFATLVASVRTLIASDPTEDADGGSDETKKDRPLTLSEIEQHLLTARSLWDLNKVQDEIAAFLDGEPRNLRALDIKRRVERAITYEKRQAARRPARLKVYAALAGLVLSACVGGFIFWTWLPQQPLIRTLTGHGADADSVSFTPDGKTIAAGGWDASIQIWTTTDGKLQLPGISGFQGHSAPFSPDGKTIAGGSQTGNNVLVWDAASKGVVQTYSGHTDKVQSVAFSPDGKSLVSGGNDHMVFVWDLTGAQPGRQLAGHTDQVYAVAFSNGGKWIASASFDQTVIVWSVASGQRVDTLIGTNKMNAAVFSPDDRYLATAGWDGDVRLWDTSNWLLANATAKSSASSPPPRPPATVKMVLPGDGQIVTTVAFSPDNKLIASGGYDNAVKVWDAATGALVRTFTGHTAAVWAVGFSPDGKELASASSDKTVKIWKTP
jgi:WD40 repeat protein